MEKSRCVEGKTRRAGPGPQVSVGENCTGSVVGRAESPGLWRRSPTCVTAPVRDTRQGTRTEMLQPLKCFRSEGEEKLPGRPLCPSIIPWPSLTGA